MLFTLLSVSLLSCFLASAADIPFLFPNGVINAASRTAGPVSPGEIVVLRLEPRFLPQLGVDSGADVVDVLRDARNPNGKLLTALNDTRVWFDDIAAPLFFATPRLVGAVVPYEVAGKKTTQIRVEFRGLRSAGVRLPVAEAAPALFTLDQSGKGPAALLNETGCCNSAINPASQGSIVALYATGEGATDPPGLTGTISGYDKPSEYPKPIQNVRVTVGGMPADIDWMGEAPHTVKGLLQLNVRIPTHAPIGDAVPLVLTVGDVKSPDGVTMAVRPSVRTVLILEPDSVTRQKLRRVLAKAGHEVFTATTADAAKALVTNHPADLIVSSLSIPAEKFAEVIAAARAKRPQVKIAAVTTAVTPARLKSADLLGAQAVLTRTMAANVLVSRVGELLKSHPMPYVAQP